MKENLIIYNDRTKSLFKSFLTHYSDRFESYYFQFKDNIKEFFRDEMNININIYFQNLKNEYYTTEWFYIIEQSNFIHSSDEIEDFSMHSYNEALNCAIIYILTQMFDINN